MPAAPIRDRFQVNTEKLRYLQVRATYFSESFRILTIGWAVKCRSAGITHGFLYLTVLLKLARRPERARTFQFRTGLSFIYIY